MLLTWHILVRISYPVPYTSAENGQVDANAQRQDMKKSKTTAKTRNDQNQSIEPRGMKGGLVPNPVAGISGEKIKSVSIRYQKKQWSCT